MVSSMMALTMSLALFFRALTAFARETLAWKGEEGLFSTENQLAYLKAGTDRNTGP